MLVVLVRDYYEDVMSPMTSVVVGKYDSDSPKGVGSVKVAVSYAADWKPNIISKKAYYTRNMYLDVMNRRAMEAVGTCSFIQITGNTYATSNTPSALSLLTNPMLMQHAYDEGMTAEQRPANIDEVRALDEATACGTAVVITVISRLAYKSAIIEFGSNPAKVWYRNLFVQKWTINTNG